MRSRQLSLLTMTRFWNQPGSSYPSLTAACLASTIDAIDVAITRSLTHSAATLLKAKLPMSRTEDHSIEPAEETGFYNVSYKKKKQQSHS